jgi:hypothetical protein
MSQAGNGECTGGLSVAALERIIALLEEGAATEYRLYRTLH